jgi:hypothetical protein
MKRTTLEHIQFNGLTISYDPAEVKRGRELVLRMRAATDAVMDAYMAKATAEGHAAAEAILADPPKAKVITDLRKQAPLRKVVKSNGRRVSTLECGHKHRVPPGHELGRKKHRCKPCALGEPV